MQNFEFLITIFEKFISDFEIGRILLPSFISDLYSIQVPLISDSFICPITKLTNSNLIMIVIFSFIF
ncbi:hypothetical protein B0A61_07615 [Flavobacterium aquatile LMG 4008 = ATCC 11947]|uniref:Uncharacterized protein n=1 Tax=Flavobacterium aquatile LMG 4008 = ATCC 11947 TaxID=1453498 RepID=A0A095UZ02_9FLAO|nr:hypothetical protein LG45_11880 [Flavobacterium aquatile LMG 4008 = ATCC 11947]OXA67671.1 hypothetical protein B0A61_07615 [Flavobacterium aquatile LMG 4008 = ATCC 11947]